MKGIGKISGTGIAVVLVAVIASCEKDYLQHPVPPKPKFSQKTGTLEATFVTSAPNTTTASYWRTADYLEVTLKDLSKSKLYSEDGRLNMTGTYNGLTEFDNEGSEELKLKAAYDADNIYILVEWTDFSTDAYRSTWFFNAESDPKKTDSSGGWTSQRNDDKMAIVFDGTDASGNAGAFSSVGCAATCHSGQKKTQAGIADLWRWSLAESETFGYASNLSVGNNTGISNDNGSNLERNAIDPMSYRSGPMYEWDGNKQEITRADGSSAVLDPSYFLVNKTTFTGDPLKGNAVYMDHDKGCYHCHGEDGKGSGDYGTAPAFADPYFNTYSREFLNERASSLEHTGMTYYQKVTQGERDDLIARIRGFSGVPGYFFNSSAITGEDIRTKSNVNVTKINPKNSNYQVLMIRALKNGKGNDVQFDPGNNKTYPFGIALMDADGKNHIGSIHESLTFKGK